jgi:hypothetical protein
VIGELHEVLVGVAAFEYEPVVELPSWWKVGQRIMAGRGETITVNDADYDRGRRYNAFDGEPPLPTRTVTVRHGFVEYTPQPFTRGEPEWWRRSAIRGETITILEDEYQRGKAAGAFTEPTRSPYGLAGEPPLHGNAVDWLNWATIVEVDEDDAPYRRLCDELDSRAADDRGQLVRAREIRRLLLEGDRTAWTNITNRVHELVSAMLATPAMAARTQLIDAVMAGEITDPDSVRSILAGA